MGEIKILNRAEELINNWDVAVFFFWIYCLVFISCLLINCLVDIYFF